LNPSLEHPWGWFSSLNTFPKVIVSTCTLVLLAILLGLFLMIDEALTHPDKVRRPLYRFSVGLILELGLTIYYWPEIYYYFRHWLPQESFFIQIGSLFLVWSGLIMLGHHIECGLLGGGFGRRECPSPWTGLQRELGLIWVTAMLIGVLSIIYTTLFSIAWLLSSTWDLVK
jgi:hypothetical protein